MLVLWYSSLYLQNPSLSGWKFRLRCMQREKPLCERTSGALSVPNPPPSPVLLAQGWVIYGTSSAAVMQRPLVWLNRAPFSCLVCHKITPSRQDLHHTRRMRRKYSFFVCPGFHICRNAAQEWPRGWWDTVLVVPMSKQGGDDRMGTLTGHWRRAAGPPWKKNILWERLPLSWRIRLWAARVGHQLYFSCGLLLWPWGGQGMAQLLSYCARLTLIFNLFIILSSKLISVLVLWKFVALLRRIQVCLKQNQKRGCKEPGNLWREMYM